MPNELHLSLFPGLNLNRDESGEWSLGLGLSPQSNHTVAHLGNPETTLLPQAREFMNSVGNTAVRLGTSLFAPADTAAEFQILMARIEAKEASLQADVLEADPRILESRRNAVPGGGERALRRMAELSQDISLPSANEESTPTVDTHAIEEARTRLQEFREFRTLVERAMENGGDRATLVAAQVRMSLWSNDPDGALDAAQLERRNHPDTPGVGELVASLESAKRRFAAQAVLQACNAAIVYEASNISEYRAGLLRNAVAPGIAQFQNQVETTERPVTELIADLYASDQHFGLVLRERGFDDLEHLIARGGTFRELNAASASFRAQFETSTAEQYRQFLFNLNPVTSETPEAFLKNLSMIIGYRIAGRIALHVAEGVVMPAVAAVTESTLVRGAARVGSNMVVNATALPPILHQNHLTWESFKHELSGNLAFSASMALVPHLRGMAGHAASIGGMTLYTYAADPNSRDVNPWLALVYQTGQHILGRLGHVAPERVAAEMDRTRIAQSRLADVANALPRIEINRPAILAAASMALAGCDPQSTLNMIPTLGMTALVGSWAAMVIPRVVQAFRGRIAEGPSAPRGVEPAQPLVLPEEVPAEVTGVVEAHESPELLTPAHARPASPLTRMIRELFLGADRPFLVERYEPGERFLILRAPTGGRAEVTRWLVGQIGTQGLEVRNGSVLGGNFRLGNRSADPSRPEGGEVLHVMVVEGPGSPEISREEMNRLHDLRRATPLVAELVPDEATDNDAVDEIDPLPDNTTQPNNEVPATALPHRLVDALKDNVIHVLGLSMVLGGCDASQAPTAVGIVAALGALAAAARHVFGNRSLEAARTNSPAEPVVHETEVAAPTTEETLRSMTSRWDQLPNRGLDRNNFAAANRDAEELGRMAGRMPMENDATQAAYMELAANLWATGNETLRNHLRPVMENAGTTLRPNIIRSLAFRVMRSRDSLRTAANLATFLPPAMRGDVYESFIAIPGGLPTLLNLHPAAITAHERAQLANAAARAFLHNDSITLPMLRHLTAGVNFETLPAAAKLVLDMRFHLEAAETAAQRRDILTRAPLTAFERAALEEALLPRIIR